MIWRVSKQAKLEDLHWHDLRHEITSRLAERLGNDVMALAQSPVTKLYKC